ncbi:uncharacterized protein LOC124205927 [Daphnia pulex]|uniref:uncharacterized protein LOC124205927 n=1 Tax=Daphnia pulex TaxID=6669 RepID=UPI001EDCBAD8|nr:uncharacterized protein LOC124205927 [Daphnia pulex]
MLAEDDGLEKFIEDYKLKLAQEKLELLSIEVTPRKQQISTGDVAQQNGSTSTTSLDKSKATDSPKLEEFDQNVITLTEQHSESDQNNAVERKKKQEEYRRILDQQLAEHKQRKEEELQRTRLLEADDFEMTSNLNTNRRPLSIRSPSPPIKSHYRKSVQVRVPSRPLTATNENKQRLSDLTELRQLYSNR